MSRKESRTNYPVAYKLVRMGKDGKLYPLYVNADEPFEIGKWMEAKPGPMLPNGKVKAKKLKELAYRPGFHSTEIPYETHIGNKDPSSKDPNKIVSIPDNLVWVEISYKDDINYQGEANMNGTQDNGKFVPRDAYLKYVAQDGFYKYKTNPNMTGDWIISGDMRINRVLDDEEVKEICSQYGLTPLPRASEYDAKKTARASKCSNRKTTGSRKTKTSWIGRIFKRK